MLESIMLYIVIALSVWTLVKGIEDRKTRYLLTRTEAGQNLIAITISVIVYALLNIAFIWEGSIVLLRLSLWFLRLSMILLALFLILMRGSDRMVLHAIVIFWIFGASTVTLLVRPLFPSKPSLSSIVVIFDLISLIDSIFVFAISTIIIVESYYATKYALDVLESKSKVNYAKKTFRIVRIVVIIGFISFIACLISNNYCWLLTIEINIAAILIPNRLLNLFGHVKYLFIASNSPLLCVCIIDLKSDKIVYTYRWKKSKINTKEVVKLVLDLHRALPYENMPVAAEIDSRIAYFSIGDKIATIMVSNRYWSILEILNDAVRAQIENILDLWLSEEPEALEIPEIYESIIKREAISILDDILP